MIVEGGQDYRLDAQAGSLNSCFVPESEHAGQVPRWFKIYR